MEGGTQSQIEINFLMWIGAESFFQPLLKMSESMLAIFIDLAANTWSKTNLTFGANWAGKRLLLPHRNSVAIIMVRTWQMLAENDNRRT